ncbi:MAG: hypothetical protein IT370_01325 [Deltaproteobacteria bacterium]|nr:hypothetical protein [Deltaproteobacteria bacterium]
MRSLRTWGLIAVVTGLAVAPVMLSRERHGSAAGEPSPGPDGAPAGTVAFFSPEVRSCPVGWAPVNLATGRMLVAVTTPTEVGVQIGTALGDREDRRHQHSFLGTVELPVKTISAAAGGNNSAARAQRYGLQGDTDPSPTGLPFAQLFVCEKQ